MEVSGSEWEELKEMFNVELIVFNNSYVDDLQDVSAQLQLPKAAA